MRTWSEGGAHRACNYDVRLPGTAPTVDLGELYVTYRNADGIEMEMDDSEQEGQEGR